MKKEKHFIDTFKFQLAENAPEKKFNKKIASLLNDLFVVNFIFKDGYNISPLNVDSVSQQLNKIEQDKKQKEKELYIS